MSTSQDFEPSHEPDIFKCGDGASYRCTDPSDCSIRRDVETIASPMTVRRVSPTGKTLWASRDKLRASSDCSIRRDSPQDMPEEKWEKYTLRQNGVWRPVGSKRSGYLAKGREYGQDPSF